MKRTRQSERENGVGGGGEGDEIVQKPPGDADNSRSVGDATILPPPPAPATPSDR